MNATLFLSLLILMGLVYILIGRLSASDVHDNEAYYLGERQFGITALALTFLATQLGGAMLVGTADVAYAQGWVALLYPLGIFLGLIALALGIGPKLRALNINTIPELFEKKYHSVQLRRFASAVSVVTLFFILVTQVIAIRKFYIALGFDDYWILFATWLVVLVYTASGGLRAAIYTDMVQAGFVIFSFLFIYLLLENGVSIPRADFNYLLFSDEIDIPWFAWLVMPMMFMLIGQDMGQRCFAAKSAKALSIATALGAVLLLLCVMFPIYFGLYAKAVGLSVSENASVLMTTIESVASPLLTAIFATAFLLIIVSTADSVLCSVSSNIAFDFSIMNQSKKSDAQKLRLAKRITFAVGTLAGIVSLLFDNIIGLLVHSYAFSVTVVFIPFIMALFLKQVRYHAALFAMSTGAFGYLLFSVVPAPMTKEALILLLALVAFIIGQKVYPAIIDSPVQD